MNERKSVLDRGRDEHVSPFTWGSLTGVVATVAWLAVGPLGPLWLYGLGWALALLGVNGVSWLLVRHRGRGLPQPAPLVAGLLRLGPESWLSAPHWAKARSVAGGFLVLATIAAGIGWSAAQEYQTLANLRHQGLRTDATVVEITGRSEEGWATAVTVRFATPSGPVQADVDVEVSSATDAKPGTRIPVVYNPARPTEIRNIAYLDGHDADGIRQGSIVIGLLAAGFLAGTVREVVRAKRQTDSSRTPDAHHPGT
ncbi:DUF3592 domain-containing protein [Streptomyces griseorubiginosus]|uniref:DUF3592 domain-containing protein n=1 Tax=Streptomyces griseorubiginosus TaxID=67304 RepID=A0AAI8PLF4_9ACTN|nr:DUF3592 domain-containing protein [Streptomyces griseorubiginosus]AYC36861.1 hypothetical protein DWG14_01071 [Streptomyces griseorubiginosus]